MSAQRFLSANPLRANQIQKLLLPLSFQHICPTSFSLFLTPSPFGRGLGRGLEHPAVQFRPSSPALLPWGKGDIKQPLNDNLSLACSLAPLFCRSSPDVLFPSTFIDKLRFVGLSDALQCIIV